MLTPGKKAPKLCLPTLDHGTFDLKAPAKPNGSVVFFYRGAHCSLCLRQMKEAEAQFRDFDDIGVDVVFVSSDDMHRARQARDNAGLHRIKVAYGLPLVAARDDWRLTISQARAGTKDPDFFNEPGIFFVQPDRRLHSCWVQSQAHARPRIEHLSGAIKLAIETGKPPRGTYLGKLPGEV